MNRRADLHRDKKGGAGRDTGWLYDGRNVKMTHIGKVGDMWLEVGLRVEDIIEMNYTDLVRPYSGRTSTAPQSKDVEGEDNRGRGTCKSVTIPKALK